MGSEAAALRRKLQRIASGKARAASDDLRVHLARTLGDRLAVVIDHSDAIRTAFPTGGDPPDDEWLAWQRIRGHLSALRDE